MASSNECVFIETGGRHHKCNAPGEHFSDNKSCVLHTTRLTNPDNAIKNGQLEDNIDKISSYLKTKSQKDATTWNRLVSKGLAILEEDNKPLRVECASGRHCSVALAEEVRKRYRAKNGVEIHVTHLDRSDLHEVDRGRK